MAEGQLVLGQVDHALDRVLDGYEPEIDVPGLDCVEHVGHRSVEHMLGCGQVVLRLQGLLGERAEWAEEADTSCWTNHVSQAIGTRSLRQSDMTGNPDSPATMSVTGGAVLARTWYGQMRSAFAKPHVELMSNAHGAATSTHPAQSVAALLGTIPSLRFVKPAGLQALADVTQREAVAAGETIIRQGEDGNDVFFIVDGDVRGVDQPLRPHARLHPSHRGRRRIRRAQRALRRSSHGDRSLHLGRSHPENPRRVISRRARYRELITATMVGWTSRRCEN